MEDLLLPAGYDVAVLASCSLVACSRFASVDFIGHWPLHLVPVAAGRVADGGLAMIGAPAAFFNLVDGQNGYY